MIFKGIKRKSNQLFFKNRLPKGVDYKGGETTEKIQKVLVFIEKMKNLKPHVVALRESLNLDKNDVTIVVFEEPGGYIEDFVYHLSEKDFGWYGKIESYQIKSILTNKYDLLINYTKVENLYFNVLLLHCNVSFKVGFAHLDQRLYDLQIDCKPENIAIFNKELEKYLKILNKL